MVHILPTELARTCDSGFFICMAYWARDATGGLFWTAALLGFIVVLFMATQRFGTARSFGFAAVTGLLGGILFAIAALIDWYTASVFIVIGVIGFIVLVLNER